MVTSATCSPSNVGVMNSSIKVFFAGVEPFDDEAFGGRDGRPIKPGNAAGGERKSDSGLNVFAERIGPGHVGVSKRRRASRDA